MSKHDHAAKNGAPRNEPLESLTYELLDHGR